MIAQPTVITPGYARGGSTGSRCHRGEDERTMQHAPQAAVALPWYHRFLLVNLWCLPIALGVPIALWMRWSQAVVQAQGGGGMFYFPTTAAEWLWMSVWCVATLPWLLTVVVIGIPLEFFLPGEIRLPAPQGSVTVGTGLMVGMVLGLLVQSSMYSLPVYSVWHVVRQRRRTMSTPPDH
ncbi:hypothetical protein HC891_28155 [Candidatus Gracilibacteria bacterium]|nr:hypothetical protein [Candidatus Gracilibacteria bacterium]